MFGAIAGGIASALAGGAMSKLFGGGQKAASGGIQGDVLATDNNTVGMGDAASDVRDEFVSVTEKLMDELAQCYNVLPQLDINNTIDHRPEGDEKWFLEN